LAKRSRRTYQSDEERIEIMSDLPTDTYIDAPKQWDNLFLGSFQLLYWLFFKPSAWRNYVKRVDPKLPFDFCLTQLSWTQWLESNLWRVFVQGYIILPILSISLIWLFLWLWHYEPTINSINIRFVVAGSLGFSLACSLAFGIVGSTAVGIVSTVLFAIAGAVVFYQQGLDYFSLIVWCLMFGMAGNVILTLSPEKHSLANRIGGIILGILIGLLGTVVLIAIPLSIIETTGIPIAIGVLALISVIAVISGCPSNNWGYFLFGGFVILYGVAAFTANGFAGGLAKGLIYGTLIGACLAIPYVTTRRFFEKDKSLEKKDESLVAAGAISGAIVIAISWGLISGYLYNSPENSDELVVPILVVPILSFVVVGTIAAIAGLTLAWWRCLFLWPFLFIWHTLIYRLDKSANDKHYFLRYHAAFWDEHQWLKLVGLQEHLLLVMDKKLTTGQSALAYLENGHQKWAVDEVQIAMDVRLLEKCKNINAIGNAHKVFKAGTREGGRFNQVSRDVNDALEQPTLHSQTLSLTSVEDRLNSLIFRELGNHATRLIPIAEKWYKIIADYKAIQHKQVGERQQMDARLLEKCKDIKAIGNAHKKVVKAVTREGDRFNQLSREVNDAIRQTTLHNQILSLTHVEEHLNGLIAWELDNATRLIPIAKKWYQIIVDYKAILHKQLEDRQQIESPYIFSNPLDIGQRNFIGRTDIVDELQNLLFQQHSSVFLQGLYRIGKTSLLMNLRGLLREPDTVVALLVDLQGAASLGNNVREFFYDVADQMINYAQKHYDLSLSPLPLEKLDEKPYKDFDKWLDKVQNELGAKTLLLMFDEFAKLDEVIRKPKSDYSEDILDVMRHWIQHRSNFQIVITSQRMEEFSRWPSLANNMVPKHLGDLTEVEARQLIEQPVKKFELRYEPDAVQRILELTHCHPALIQLLGREIVVLKNKQALDSRFLVVLQDVEKAVPTALETGMSIFTTSEIRATDAGNALLRYMATLGEEAIINQEALAEHCTDSLENVLKVLQSLELIEKIEDGYQFRIELFRRWYAKQ
jgi:hypothetical protein